MSINEINLIQGKPQAKPAIPTGENITPQDNKITVGDVTIYADNINDVGVKVDNNGNVFIDANKASGLKVETDSDDKTSKTIHISGSQDNIADDGLKLSGDTVYVEDMSKGSLKNKVQGNGQIIKEGKNDKNESVTKVFNFKNGLLINSHKEKLLANGQTKVVERNYEKLDSEGNPERMRYKGQYTTDGKFNSLVTQKFEYAQGKNAKDGKYIDVDQNGNPIQNTSETSTTGGSTGVENSTGGSSTVASNLEEAIEQTLKVMDIDPQDITTTIEQGPEGNNYKSIKDSKGNVISNIYFDTNGKITNSEKYEYVSDNKKVRTIFYNAQNEKIGSEMYYYLSSGKTQVDSYDENGKFTETKFYDENGKLVTDEDTKTEADKTDKTDKTCQRRKNELLNL